MTRKAMLFVGFLIVLGHWVTAQPTMSHLHVERYPYTSLPSYLRWLGTAKADTGKVNLLLRISSIYHWNDSRGSADSSIFYAREAEALSNSLRFSEGRIEAAFIQCKSLLQKKEFDQAKKILERVHGEQHVRILLVLAEYYINGKDVKPEQLLNAYPYLQLANRMSVQLRSRHWMTESGIAQAKYHFRLGEIDKGRDCFYEVIRYHEKIGDKPGQAHWWHELGRYLPETNTYALQVYSFGKAKALYREIGNDEELADCLHEEGSIHELHNRMDLTESLYLSELNILKSAGLDKNLFASYQRLSAFYQSQNNLDKALRYALLGLENLKAMKDSRELNSIYWTIGDLYHTLGDHAASIKYYKLVLATSPIHMIRTYTLISKLVDAEIKTNNAAAGLQFLTSFLKTRGEPETVLNKQLVAYLYARCYAAMQHYSTAERYYLEVIRLNSEVESTEKFWWRNTNSVSGPTAYLTIGRFYVERAQFEKAARFVKNAANYSQLSPSREMETRFLSYKIDSAAGNHLASFRNYQRFIFLRDSIQRITKDEQFAVLKANFKTAQKEKDIKLLQKEALLRKRQLELKSRTEKFTYAGIAGLIGLLVLLYNGYRVKRKKNLQLEEHQRTINIKNSSLLRLVDEKEWLLKEVHHRVKNNLQIVISLLNSQSAHLKEDVAINAIVESKHRIQAISMLHQRIYQSENMVWIAMSSYIHELVYYLDNSFNLGKRILFYVNVANIELDLSQAVPVGLILNEAITNSLKYAFPDGREGKIQISFEQTDPQELLLTIADDGIGLSSHINIDQVNTFGLKLIRGLSEDLDGTFQVYNAGGTKLSITFPHKRAASPTTEQDIPVPVKMG
ncbi:tetratricopeptide repeat-containing sensor histidine kinase [Dyadobacter jiangsuensis]